MCMWTKEEDKNAMRVASSLSQLKNAKFNGRKPDKIVTRANQMDKLKVKDLKKYIAYDGVIVVGSDVVFDGKHGKR